MKQERFTSITEFTKEAFSPVRALKSVAKPWMVAPAVGAATAGIGAGMMGEDENTQEQAYGLGPSKLETVIQALKNPWMWPLAIAGTTLLSAGTELGAKAVEGVGSLIRGARGGSPELYSSVVGSDPILADADSASLQEAYTTMARFAPTLSTDTNAVRSFLREAATSGGGVNYNTIKLLSEAEAMAQKV